MIYEDGYVLNFKDGTQGLFSFFNPLFAGPVISETFYTIKDEDTLFSIARDKYKDTKYWYILGEWNNLADPITLVTGELLKLPNFG